MIRPKENEIYRHFKGNLYQIICVAEDSETGRPQVIYRALYSPYKIYSRDLSMFMSPVDRAKYPDADQDNRFELMIFDDMTLVDTSVSESEDFVDNTVDSIDRRVQTRSTVSSFSNPKRVAVEAGLNLVDDKKDVKSDAYGADSGKLQPSAYEKADKSGISPVLLRFLETEGVHAQIECLTEIRDSLTPEIMTSIEFSVGMEEAQKGDIYDRYRGVKNYLQLKLKYERQHR